MRIVLVGGGVEPIPPTGYGGTERFIWELRGALAAAGHEPIVVNRVRHRRNRDEYPFAWELPRLLRAEKYDVVHVNSPVVANRLALGGRPYVYTSHSRHWYYRAQLSHRWGYWLERRAVRRAAAPVALTESLARTMRAAVRSTRRPIAVIPFGVDAKHFRPDWEHRTGGVALGVGVVSPFKRWELAAEALKGTGLRFVLVGPTPDRGYADRVRAVGDHVEIVGEVAEVTLAAHYSTSDFLVHPSQAELLPGTVVQALSAGLPVLGGPAVETLVEDGRTGWCVPDSDLAAFVAGIRQRATELGRDAGLRRHIGDTARSVAQERFSWPRVVEQYLEVYHSVAGLPTSP
ncbi:MAG: glycosyltransferase family 4 protein [Thermoplasmata archaeon]